MFNSIGLPSFDQSAGVVAEIARVLRPGVRFVLDVFNRDSFVHRFSPGEEFSWTASDGSTISGTNWFDYVAGRRIRRELRCWPDGRQIEVTTRAVLLTPSELGRLLEASGLTVTGWFGGTDERPASRDSGLIVVGTRN